MWIESYRFVTHEYRLEIDEKWFQLNPTKADTRRRRKDKDKKEPARTMVNKNQPMKLMFLLGLGCPQTNPNNPSEFFNGKLGIWPIAAMEQAKKTSSNRAVGTWEAKPSKFFSML